MKKIELGVNIDHIATLRQARGGSEPNLLEAAIICEKCNVDGITVHLREDRRHIQDQDVYNIKKEIKNCKLNLEMALADDIINIAKDVVPQMVTLVPEKREELTTEGGLDVKNNFKKIASIVNDFKKLGIIVSLFIEPDKEVIKASKDTGAEFIEIHTGTYANQFEQNEYNKELERIYEAAEFAVNNNIRVNAGHGLNYTNVKPILKCKGLEELNIGHSIVSYSVFVGLEKAVKDMQHLLVL